MTGGLANPLLSIGEDTVTGVTVILAFVAPIIALIVLALGAAWMIRRWQRRRQSP
jgi:hypothetical protein